MDNTFDSLYWGRSRYLAGVDEVGVTSIAGPIVAACVVLPRERNLDLFQIDDSKKIKRKHRQRLAAVVQKNALAYGIGTVAPVEIDALNVAVASNLAMRRAIADCLARFPTIDIDLVLVDGNRPIDIVIPHELVVKGDEKSLSVAAASILAKVHHSEYMEALHQINPVYGFVYNEGYKCTEHYAGLDQDGIWIGVHRTSIWPLHKNAKEKKEWVKRRSLWVHKTESNLYRNPRVCASDASSPLAP